MRDVYYINTMLALSALLSAANAFMVPVTTTTRTTPYPLAPLVNNKARDTTYNNKYYNHAPPAFLVSHRRRSSSKSQLYMGGWGPEPIWSVAKVLENTPACTSGKSVSIVVEVDSETASQYKIPGQYVQVRLNNETKPLFLAIASAPNDGANDDNTRFEFLIKKTQGNEWATSLSGSTSTSGSSSIEISQVLGKGFRVDENFNGFKYDFPTQNILLFATGSGIAPIKAAMESNGFLNVGSNDGRTCRLYYGEKTRDDVCFTSLFNEWERNGYEVVPVLSQQSDEDTSGGKSDGRCGYVQNALEEDGVPIPRNSGALLCGQAKMAESVSEILTKAGVFEGRILTNF